jgi:SAM-dependent methyltransferase
VKVSIEIPQLSRESYRERLYKHYLVNCKGVDVDEARAGLHASAPYLNKLIRKYLPKNKNTRILDLGCGYGALLYWLKAAGYKNLEGVDRSAEQVEGAHRLGLDFVQQADIKSRLADRPSASCDVVVAYDVLEHFGKDEALEFADQVYRVLGVGGLFVLHLPNGAGSFGGSVAHGDFTHELILNRSSLGQLLRCVGFSEIRSYEDTPVVHGLMSAARYFVWKIYRSFLRIAYAAETGETGRDLILTQNFLTIARK